MDTGKRLIYESGVMKKRRIWLEKLIKSCEEEIKTLRDYGNMMRLEVRKDCFKLKVLYNVDGRGNGEVIIEDKKGNGTLSYAKRNGCASIMSIRADKVKTLLTRIIEDCEEEGNVSVGV